MFNILKFVGFLIMVFGAMIMEDPVTHAFVWEGAYAIIFGCTMVLIAHFCGKYSD